MKYIYSNLMLLFYFVISFELLSMQHHVKTSSSLGDLENTSDEVIITKRIKKSKSLRNLRSFQTLDFDLEDITPNFAKYGNTAIKKIPCATAEEISQIIFAHKLLNGLQNSHEKPIQNGLSNSNILVNSGFNNLAKYHIGKILIKSENDNKNKIKNISPATTKRIKYLTTGSINLQKLKNAINNGNTNNGENGSNEKNRKIN